MKNYSNQEIRYIWLDSFLGLEYKYKCEIIDCILGEESLSSMLTINKQKIMCVIGEKEFYTLYSASAETFIKFHLEEIERKGITAITILSNEYPEKLKQTPCPPLVLYAKGDVSLLTQQSFSIVGSRKSLPISIKLAETYTKALCDAGLVIVTGIAEGIDSAVLNAVLDCKGKAISVIAGGFDNVYPKSNQNLLEKIAKSGLVISEYPPETIPKPFHFPVRNRIIAGLGMGVLVVSAGQKSGTLYTAEYAVDYGKEVFAIPYSVGVQSGVGCNDLIKKGALLTDNPDDILDFYQLDKEKKKQVELSETEKAIIEVLSNQSLHVEKICALLGKKIFEVTPFLSILEIKGIVFKSGNVYGLIGSKSEE